ncbi:chromate transporter [Rhodopila sp.]|jgi:chromate transporter|uniref:chromate transporter n=1 Tax=Rhodopila sp. TaxID=2480087 RepID=UPI002C35ED5E|nr:chromate transporter [Rhodopila sp.]HVZ06997.1 chromate transporter [Rhodopila sp.]
MIRDLTDLALVYGQLSLLAFGGANAVIPEMQRQVVEVHHWTTAREFASLYALAQAAPGPNMMVVSLVGWRVAGVIGAIVATVAITLPSSILTLLVAGLWFRFRDAPWRRAVQAGLQPVTAALIMASAVLLVGTVAIDVSATLVVLAATALFLRTKLHPLLILGGAAALGVAGLVG